MTSDGERAKLFKPTPRPSGGFSYAEWKAYWNALTDDERQSLRDKAQWEHMTLVAVAMEWGAVRRSSP